MLVRELGCFAAQLADRRADNHSKDTFVQHGLADEVLGDLGAVSGVENEVECEVDEGDCHAVVAGGFCTEKITEVGRDLSAEFSLADDRLGQHGVCGCDGGADEQPVGECHVWEDGPDEKSDHQPPHDHDWHHERDHRPEVVIHAFLRELDPDREDIEAEEDPADLQSEIFVVVQPGKRVEPLQAVRAHYKTIHGGQHRLAQVEVLLNYGRAH